MDKQIIVDHIHDIDHLLNLMKKNYQINTFVDCYSNEYINFMMELKVH